MNKDMVQGSWSELKGKIKVKWAKLTDNDLDALNGNLEMLSGTIQKTYGYAKDIAENEYNEFKSSLSEKTNSQK